MLIFQRQVENYFGSHMTKLCSPRSFETRLTGNVSFDEIVCSSYEKFVF